MYRRVAAGNEAMMDDGTAAPQRFSITGPEKIPDRLLKSLGIALRVVYLRRPLTKPPFSLVQKVT
jgi:hypothetical protein